MRPVSPRELDVARLVAEDLTNKQIARKLGIVESTVKTHLHRTAQILGCQTRVGVALWYVRHHGKI